MVELATRLVCSILSRQLPESDVCRRSLLPYRCLAGWPWKPKGQGEEKVIGIQSPPLQNLLVLHFVHLRRFQPVTKKLQLSSHGHVNTHLIRTCSVSTLKNQLYYTRSLGTAGGAHDDNSPWNYIRRRRLRRVNIGQTYIERTYLAPLRSFSLPTTRVNGLCPLTPPGHERLAEKQDFGLPRATSQSPLSMSATWEWRDIFTAIGTETMDYALYGST